VRENRVTLAFLNAPAGSPATLAALISSEGTARYSASRQLRVSAQLA